MSDVTISFTASTPDGAARFLTIVPQRDLGNLVSAQITIPAATALAKATNTATFNVSSPADFQGAITRITETQADLGITIQKFN